jgi:hypothetical protein
MATHHPQPTTVTTARDPVHVLKVLTTHWGAAPAKALAALLAAWVLVSCRTPAPIRVNRARPQSKGEVATRSVACSPWTKAQLSGQACWLRQEIKIRYTRQLKVGERQHERELPKPGVSQIKEDTSSRDFSK